VWCDTELCRDTIAFWPLILLRVAAVLSDKVCKGATQKSHLDKACARCREKRCVRRRDRSSAAQSPADATKSAEERHVAGLKPTRLLPQRLIFAVKSRQERPILKEMRSQWRQSGPFVVNVAYVAVRCPANGTIN